MARTDMAADALRKIGGLDGTTLGPGVVAADWARPQERSKSSTMGLDLLRETL
jgi:hypothetical protein